LPNVFKKRLFKLDTKDDFFDLKVKGAENFYKFYRLMLATLQKNNYVIAKYKSLVYK